MRLPEYDNRPPPGTPLYETESEFNSLDDIKYPMLFIALPLVTIGLLVWTVTDVVNSITALLG